MIDRQAPLFSDQRRSSAPMANPSFVPSMQPRHSSFSQSQTHRLSIAERFMAPNSPKNQPQDAKSQRQDDAKSISFNPSYHPNTYHSNHEDPPQRHPLGTHHLDQLPSHPLDQPHYKPKILSTSPQKQYYPSKKPRQALGDPPRHNNKTDPPLKSSVVVRTFDRPEKTWPDHPTSEKKQPSKEEFCHRGSLLLCFFFFLTFGGVFLFLIWPRVPLLRIEGASVVSPVEVTQNQQGWMENVMFSSSWLVNVTVDNRQNYLPTRLNRVQVIVKDAVTNALVGKGAHNDDPMDIVLMDGISTVSLLINVNYQARDLSDPTLSDLVHACHFSAALPLHFWITLYMFGFDWLGFIPTVIATPASSGFSCPV